jgi:hypothetical protein
MRSIVSLLLALSVLTGFVAQASADEPAGQTVGQQDWHRNFGL